MGNADGLGGHRLAAPHPRSRQRFQPLMARPASVRPIHAMRPAVRPCVCLAALAATVLSAALYAAVPTFWTVATQSDFLKGDVEGLSIDSDGRVFLGPSTSL